MTSLQSLLKQLERWRPVAVFGFNMAGQIEQGFTPEAISQMEEWKQMEQWAVRWERLDPQLRLFYADWADRSETASIALHQVLEGRPRMAAWQYKKLEELWTQVFLMEPNLEMAPRIILEEETNA